MLEIERKFLVNSEAYKSAAHAQKRITQGFLSTHPERTVRVRIADDKGFITIKGKTNDTGITRFEWEKEILLTDAEALLKIAKSGTIDKIRFEVKVGQHTYEVDEFLGQNKGLVVAEVELNNEHEYFEKPVWLGEEVSGIPKYYNSQLSKHPFKNW